MKELVGRPRSPSRTDTRKNANVVPDHTQATARLYASAGYLLESLKAELEDFGKLNDATTKDPHRRMLNITRDTGQLLLMLVQVAGAQRVLEIGTSNGYSTLWLAESAKAIGGTVTTIEFDKDMTDMESVNFTRAGSLAVHHTDSIRRGSIPRGNGREHLRSDFPGFRPRGLRALVDSLASNSAATRLVDCGQRHVTHRPDSPACHTRDR